MTVEVSLMTKENELDQFVNYMQNTAGYLKVNEAYIGNIHDTSLIPLDVIFIKDLFCISLQVFCSRDTTGRGHDDEKANTNIIRHWRIDCVISSPLYRTISLRSTEFF